MEGVESPEETTSEEAVSAEEGLSEHGLSGLTGGVAGSPDASFGKSWDVIFAHLSSTGFTWVRRVSAALKVLQYTQAQRTRRNKSILKLVKA